MSTNEMTMKVILLKSGAAAVHDALGEMTVLDSRLRPISQPVTLVGPAFTVETPSGDNLGLHRAAAEAPVGAVIVAASGGNLDVAVWGDVLSRISVARGVAGLVLDGAIRDSDAIRALDFPVFALGTALPAPTKTDPGRLNCPIALGRVEISPGDWIVADGDGVVVVPQARLDATVRDAQAIRDREAEVVRRATQGESTVSQA